MARRMVRIPVVAVLLLLAGAVPQVRAQAPPAPPPPGRERIERRVEMIKIYKLTEALQLDEEQATRFFPRYRAYETEQRAAREQLNRAFRELEAAVKGGREDGELIRLMQQTRQAERRMLTRRDEFFEGVSDLLSPRQKAALMVFERRFPQVVKQAIEKIRRGGGPPPRPGRGDPWR